jgi:hypothetical protein
MYGGPVVDGNVGKNQRDNEPADAPWQGKRIFAANGEYDPGGQGNKDGLGDGEKGSEGIFPCGIEQSADGAQFGPAQPVDGQIQINQGKFYNETRKEDRP